MIWILTKSDPNPDFPPRIGAQIWQPSSPTKYGSRPLPVNSHLLQCENELPKFGNWRNFVISHSHLHFTLTLIWPFRNGPKLPVVTWTVSLIKQASKRFPDWISGNLWFHIYEAGDFTAVSVLPHTGPLHIRIYLVYTDVHCSIKFYSVSRYRFWDFELRHVRENDGYFFPYM